MNNGYDRYRPCPSPNSRRCSPASPRPSSVSASLPSARFRNMSKKNFWQYAILLAVAIIFTTVFSYTTSPLYQEWGNTPDSPIFQIIGKYWAQGKIPYRDLWDMKGPYIFFVNALGYWLTGASIGVYCIQIVSLFFTIAIIFQLFRRYFSVRSSFLYVLLSLAGLSYIYEGGNMTEEYILPPLSLSFYYLAMWLDGYEYRNVVAHAPRFALVYGILLGLSLMSRLTNALGLMAAVGVVVIVLLRQRMYVNLLHNAVMFLSGFTITVMPFLIYFYMYDSLQEMWNATFLYPLTYAGNSSNDISSTGLHYFFLSYFNAILLVSLVVYIVVCRKEVSVRSLLLFATSFVPLVWFCQGNGFGHYGMIVFPLFALSIIEANKLRMRFLPYAVSLLLLFGCATKVHFMFFIYQWKNKEVTQCRQLLEKVPEVDYSSFVAYNCNPNIYLDLNICPSVPYFALQGIAEEKVIPLSTDIYNSFRMVKPKWVLVSERGGGNSVRTFIADNYSPVISDRESQLTLYRRR